MQYIKDDTVGCGLRLRLQGGVSLTGGRELKWTA